MRSEHSFSESDANRGHFISDWGNSIGATAAVDVKQALVEALASLYSLDRTVLVSEGDVAWIRQGIKVCLSILAHRMPI